jgi:hypothetical protein
MTSARLFLIAMIIATFVAPAARSQNGQPTAQIWVNAFSLHSVDRVGQWKGTRLDDADQWKPEAPWRAVAAHTKVAKLIASNIEHTSDDDLKAVIEDVKRRHLELALESGPLVRSAECTPANGAAANETYGSPGELELVLQKIRRNGGELRYFDMDEPFFFGHRDPSGCHLPATQLAQQVATSVASARRIFPGLQVGDSEVVNADRQWISELVQWVDAYRAATGEPLAFFHADVQWSELAMHNLVPLAAQIKARRIPFGIFYTADESGTSDLEWTQSAVRHFTEIEQVLDLHLDQALFATWTHYPEHVLPENQPGTLMNVPLQYLRASPSLRLSQSGQEITGTLSGRDGEPVVGAAITLMATDVGGRLPTARHLAGTVPERATSAVVGIRIGLEGACVCAGPTTVMVGGIHYREQGKPPQDISPITPPVQGASVHTLPVVPGKTFFPNLKQFPVTPGAAYTLDTSLSAPAAADHAGYVTVIFLDAAGKGLSRENLWFAPSVQPLGRAMTDARGAFSLRLPDNVASARPDIRAGWAGTASFRPAMAVLPWTSPEVQTTGPAPSRR